MAPEFTPSIPSLSDLPFDELIAYGRELGLLMDESVTQAEVLRLIRDRQELLVTLERDALMDVVVWARTPVRRSASKEQLAKQIAMINRTRFDGLSDRGLLALSRLHGVSPGDGDSRTSVERRLRRIGGLWARLKRKRRAVVGNWIGRVVEGARGESEYRFLPEEDPAASLKETIEDVGVVGGIAQKLRGAADHYVHQKLDEIERRIDRKLDEIDRRLCDWRDRELHNRLRLVKITLITAILVATISLGYDYMKERGQGGPEPTSHPVSTPP